MFEGNGSEGGQKINDARQPRADGGARVFDETRQLPSIAEALKAQRKHPTLGFVGQVLPLCCQRPWNCEVRCGSVRQNYFFRFIWGGGGSFGGGAVSKVSASKTGLET